MKSTCILKLFFFFNNNTFTKWLVTKISCNVYDVAITTIFIPTDPIDFSGAKVKVKGDNVSDNVLVVNTSDDDILTDWLMAKIKNTIKNNKWIGSKME